MEQERKNLDIVEVLKKRHFKIAKKYLSSKNWPLILAATAGISAILSFKFHLGFGAFLGIALLLFGIIAVLVILYGLVTYTGTIYNEETKTEIVRDSFECGSAERARMEEIEATCSHDTYAKTTANFIGELPRDGKMGYIKSDTQLYSINEGFGLNGNAIYFGSPGCGKSATILMNFIFQTIRRGESMVVSDTKGELYNNTSTVAKAYGYTTKIMNLDPAFLIHSDACDPLKVVISDPNMAPSFAETICANISDEEGFWADEQMNLLTFFLLWVACPGYQKEKTLPGVFKEINTATPEIVELIGNLMMEDHPAKVYYNNYASADKIVKGNTLGGLQVKLSKLGQPIMQKLFGTDEIDFRLPGLKKCIYYVNLPANDRSNNYFSALFFDVLMREQESLARELGGSCKLRIKYYMDEFYNLGIIPHMDNRLGTLRSAGIDIILFLQSLGQLQVMYPDPQWEIVMECVSNVVLLKTNTNTTAEYLSKMCGVQTVKSTGIRRERMKGAVALQLKWLENTMNTQRSVYFPDELRRLANEEMICIPSGHNPIKFRKVLYTSHPMMALVRPVKSQEHIPDWIMSLTEEEYVRYGITENSEYEDEDIWDLSPLPENAFEHAWTEEKEAARIKKCEEYLRRIRNGEQEIQEKSRETEKNTCTSSQEGEVPDFSIYTEEYHAEQKSGMAESGLEELEGLPDLKIPEESDETGMKHNHTVSRYRKEEETQLPEFEMEEEESEETGDYDDRMLF